MHISRLSAQAVIRMLMLCKGVLFTSNGFLTFSTSSSVVIRLYIDVCAVYASLVSERETDQISVLCYW